MRLLPALALSAALAGCAGAPTAETRVEHLFHDAMFGPASERIDARDVFALSPEMTHYLDVEIADQLTSKGRHRALFDALYSKSQLKLDYDAKMTRNASQAFAARSGNCLSLVIMTAAFAKPLGLTVRYQRVVSEETWARSGGIYFASNHINITLGRKHGDPRVLFTERNALTIDFIPPTSPHGQLAWDIREEMLVAMYMNNRAAETLAHGQVDDAYWWARAAVLQDPKFLPAQNTLGVIYKRTGHLKEAEQILSRVLEAEPANTHAMSNLAMVLAELGRGAESQALMTRLERLQPDPPYHYFQLGLDAMRAKDFARARDLFAKEVERDAYNHEFHFWLAAAYTGLGNVAQSRKHLLLALENSPTHDERDLYISKLNKISKAGR